MQVQFYKISYQSPQPQQMQALRLHPRFELNACFWPLIKAIFNSVLLKIADQSRAEKNTMQNSGQSTETNTYTGLGTQLAKSQDLEFPQLLMSVQQDTSISQCLPAQQQGCQEKALLKASGHNKSGLPQADLEATWPQTLPSASLFTLCKLLSALARPHSLLHSCTLGLQFTSC